MQIKTCRFRKISTFGLGLLVVLTLLHEPAHGDADLYSFPKIDDQKIKVAAKEQKNLEPFVQALSKKTGIPETLLGDSISKGYGRTELIRLILISKKSGKSLAD